MSSALAKDIFERAISRRLPGESLHAYARRFNIPYSTLVYLGEGRHQPRAKTLVALAQHLDYDPGWLTFGTMPRDMRA